MIIDYKIEQINGEETLSLYIDLTFEFAKLDSTQKKKKFLNIIKDFLKEKNVEFNGKKITILSGGLLIATLTLKTPISKFNDAILTQDTYPSSVIVLEDNTDSLSNLVNEKLQEKSSTELIETTSSNEIKTEPQTSIQMPKVNHITSSKKETTLPQVEKQSTVEEQPQSSNSTIVTIRRTNGSILNLELEEYIIGVVGAEMPASFHLEALRAQAIIARTYALNSLEKGITLTDNSSTQNYKSNEELNSMWGTSYNTYYNKIKNAVDSTRGLYLTYQGNIIEAVYHSTSNGSTEDALYVWGNSFPYLVPVSSPYDSSNSSYIKSTQLSYETISTKLGIDVTPESDIQILSKTTGNRVENISFDGTNFTGVTIRNTLGLRSADFDIEKSKVGITFTTRGFGHGVGLSQYGSNGLAKNGANYETILKHYYRGVDISYHA